MSTKYIAVLRQSGGCDYTIGCGIEVVKLDAESMDDAQRECEALLENNYWDVESRLDSITVHEVTRSSEMDLNRTCKEIAKRKKDELREDEEKRHVRNSLP